MIAVSIVFWLSLSLSRPVPPAPVGRPCIRPASVAGVVGFLGSGRAAAAALAALWPVASSPTSSVARRPSPWPASSDSAARSRTRACAHRAPNAADLLRPRLDPRAARPAGPLPDRPRPGVLRRRDDRGAAAVRDRQRRPSRPVARRRRDHRHPDGRRDHVHLPRLGRRRRPPRSARRDAARQRARASPRWSPTRSRRTSRSCGSPRSAAGAGGASIDVGIASVVSDHTPLASRAAAMAGWNAITGARGIVAAFTMSILLQVGSSTSPAACCCAPRSRRSASILYARASTDPIADVARRAVAGRAGRRAASGARSAADP